MKTTLEIPDPIFRRAKSKAAERGVPFRQLTEAVEDKLKSHSWSVQRPWMKHIGKLKSLRKETARIQKTIENTFERIDPDVWDSDSLD